MDDLKTLIERAQIDPESLTPEETKRIVEAFMALGAALQSAGEAVARQFEAMGRAVAVFATSIPELVKRMEAGKDEER